MPFNYQLNRLDPIYPFYFNISGLSEVITQKSHVENCTLQPFYTRQNRAIAYYEYDREKNKLYEKASELLFNREGSYSPETYPASVEDILGTGEPMLVLRTIQGISFYRPSKNLPQKFELMAQDSRFHDVNHWNQVNHTIKFGHFYSDKKAIGVLTHSSREGIKFYVVSKDYVKRNHSMPLWSVGIKNPEIIQQPKWNNPWTDFFIADTRGRGQEDIILRSDEGLSLYEFKPNYSLYNFLNTPVAANIGNSTQKDRLLFTNLTYQNYQDIVVWNDRGLFVYQYQSNNNSYTVLDHNAIFSKNRGWKLEHFSSLHPFDLDGDQRDELILTGPQGVTFLTFDPIQNEWHSILEGNSLIGAERYAQVLKTLPSCLSNPSIPTLLTQDQNSLRLFEITKVDAEIDKDNEKVSAIELSHPIFTLPIRFNATVPQQLTLPTLTEKRLVRLSEKLDYSPLLQAVNTIVGQVQFTLPLAVVPTPIGLTIPLTITYNSQQTEASLLGKGWSSTPLEFITVETSGSVYLEDHRYYLFAQGNLQLLTLVNSADDRWTFKLSNQTHVNIIYEINGEEWRIETSEEILFFGKSLNPLASSAIQWGLSWTNWRGNGNAVSEQKPVALAWYLNERQVKKNKQALYYQYEVMNAILPGGREFTEYVYLKKITDRQDTCMVFDYGLKPDNEYDDPLVVDAEGIIQAAPKQRYYFRGYQVQTRDTEQTIQFGYKVDLNQRYLISIEQIFETQREKVLQFSYEEIGNHRVLTSSMLPNGAIINFNYHPVATLPLLGLLSSYSVDQLPSIMSGPDYTLITFLSESNYLMLHVLNKEATETYVTSSWNSASQLAPLGRKGVNHYQIVPQQSFFAVELDYGTERDLYLFHRHEGKWSWKPTIYAFNKAALIRVSKDFVVVAEPNQSALTLLEWQNTEGKWKKHSLPAPLVTAKPPKRLSAYDRFIVVYDDDSLWIGYREKHAWYSQSLKELSHWASDCENILRKLDLDNEAHEAILSALNQQGLQIQSNFILLSTLQERDHQLFSKIQLLLLNDKYQIAQQAEYEIAQEKLLEVIGNLITPDGQIFKLGYQVDNNRYTIKFIDSPSFKDGKSFDDTIKDNSDPSIKQLWFQLWQKCLVGSLQKTGEGQRGTTQYKTDPKGCEEKTKRQIFNEIETSFKRNRQEKLSLVNWSRYQITLTGQGVRCSNQEIFFTGSNWKFKSISEEELQGNCFSQRLGNSFLLEKAHKSDSFKLYRQTKEGSKQNVPLLDLMTTELEKIVLRYPNYLAYQTDQGLVKFIEFSDHRTVGQYLEFPGEHLYIGSPYHALVTYPKSVKVSSAPAKGIELVLPNVRKLTLLPVPESFIVRSLSSLFGNTLKQVVNRLTLSAEGVQRAITYDYANSFNRTENGTPFYQKVIIIPGIEKKESGWREEARVYNTSSQQLIRHETLFDSQGKKVLSDFSSNTMSTSKANNTFKENDNFAEEQKSTLLDNTGQRLIADFSPYILEDEEVGYYGFESYEVNQLSKISKNSTVPEKTWQFNEENIVKRGFSFTGENYLHLGGRKENNDTYLEGIFQPRRQDTTYLASCWLRCSQSLELNQAVPFLKAIVFTDKGEEVLGVLSRVKFQSGDWSYLELLIDLPFVKTIYQEMIRQATGNVTVSRSTIIPRPIEGFSYSSPANEAEVPLTVVLLVGSATNMSVDLDHIRFSPLDSVFPVSVYHPVTGQPTARIQTNGLVTRTLYNSLQQPIATLKEQGQLECVSTETKTGRLFPILEEIEQAQLPSRVTFQPESGFYEEFDIFALRTRWIANEPEAWKIAPGQLWHQATYWSQIEADSRLLDSTSVAFRCEIALSSSSASLRWHWQGGYVELTRQGISSTLSCSSANRVIGGLPTQGEWIFFVERNRLWVWSEGVLLFDQAWSADNDQSLKPWTRLMLEAQGHVAITDLCLMNNPSVQIEYFNRFGEKIQVIVLKDTQTVQVSEALYDNLGRPAITSKVTALTRTSNQPLLAYYPDFITNDHPSHPNSVWKTGYLAGEVDRFNSHDHGFAYQRVAYAPNPLNEEQAIGLPGRDFSVAGPYAKRCSKQANIDFLTNLFPLDRGYRQQVESQPNGRKQVEIFDKNNNRVALYQHVSGYNHQLSTYEYDENNHLIKVLPPLYHEKVHSRFKTQPLKTGEQHLSALERYWQRLGTYYVYHENGHILSKTTPDGGTVTFTYTPDNQIKFMAFGTNQVEAEKVVYLDYNQYGQLHRTGYLNPPLSQSELLYYVNSTEELPGAQDYQRFYYAEDHVEPILRNRIKRLVTFNEEKPFLEEFQFNADHQIEVKGILSMLAVIENQYVAGRLQTLSYPITIDGKPFKLTYHYNKQGQIVALGTDDSPNYYAKFDYHSSGQLLSEHHHPTGQYSFVRHYQYSSPGFLKKIMDPFLTEDLTYTEGGYGQAGYGDGMVMQTAFNASWFKDADPRSFIIDDKAFADDDQWVTPEISTRCVQALINEGYLDRMKRPIKQFYPKEFNTLPLFCSDGAIGYQIAQTLAERYFPVYGHYYAYGNYQELTKGKYFVSDPKKVLGPLQPTTFSDEILGLTSIQSKAIWSVLHQAEYLNQDKRQGDFGAIYGIPDRSFFREEALREDLRELENLHTQLYTPYTIPIKKLLMAYLGDRRELSYEEFQTIFLKWKGIGTYASRSNEIKEAKTDAQRIWNVLRNKLYLQEAPLYALSSLETNFKYALRNFVDYVPDIVRVLSRHFAHVLGETTFDVESYDIDANGNHRHFYTGFNRYELDYRNGTNQIHTVKINPITTLKPEERFPMQHDMQGNVIQAMHRGIQQINYDPTSQRTTRILLTDGRSLKFSYDAKGERVLKRVLLADGNVSKETYYIRDEQGQVLVDYQVFYTEQEPSNTILTVYLYGPRGLLGFIRNNAYYSVINDHEGSTRLIVKDRQVEAAYDYLPYGQIMRIYGNNPEAHIVYRYTGQEWDEETGLYNYRARLYDPSIGRFYQIDPKEQYFSPYKYAGNSPVSLIDPYGEEAFTIIVLALLGAYLGGASANNNWDPARWNFKSAKTWAGIGLGGLAGGLTPLGTIGSVGFLTSLGLSKATAIGIISSLGAGGAYLSTASVNRNWDPIKWNWENPGTYQGLFTGVSAGSSILGGFSGVKSIYTGFSSPWAKSLFIGTSSLSGAGLAYGGGVLANQGNAVFWKWNWEDPATWEALLGGGLGGASLPAGALQARQFLKGNLVKIARNGRAFGKAMQSLKQLLKSNPNTLGKDLLAFNKHINSVNLLQSMRASGRILGGIGIAGGMTYLQGSALSDSWDSWDMSSFTTYQTIFNGLLSIDTLNTGKKHSKKNNFLNRSPRCRRADAGSCDRSKKPVKSHTWSDEFQEIKINSMGRNMIIPVGKVSSEDPSGSFQKNDVSIYRAEATPNQRLDEGGVIEKKNKKGKEPMLFIGFNNLKRVIEFMTQSRLRETRSLSLYTWIKNLGESDKNTIIDRNKEVFYANGQTIRSSEIPRDLAKRAVMAALSERHVKENIERVNFIKDVLDKIGDIMTSDMRNQLQGEIFGYSNAGEVLNVDVTKAHNQFGISGNLLSELKMEVAKRGVREGLAVHSRKLRSIHENKLDHLLEYYLKNKINKANANARQIGQCISGARYGQTYVKGITCYTENMRMMVFLKDSDVKLEKAEDSYSKQSCRPIEFNGRSSAYCEGDKTNIVYTPEIPKRPFEQLNEQLILLQVVLHQGKKLYRWFQNLFSEKNSNAQIVKENPIITSVTDEQTTLWKEALDSIEKRLMDLTKVNTVETDLRWAYHILEDRKEEFEYLSHLLEVNSQEANAFSENLQAFMAEIEVIESLHSITSEHSATNSALKTDKDDISNHNPFEATRGLLFSKKNTVFNGENSETASWLKEGFFKAQPFVPTFIAAPATNNSLSSSGKQGVVWSL